MQTEKQTDGTNRHTLASEIKGVSFTFQRLEFLEKL